MPLIIIEHSARRHSVPAPVSAAMSALRKNAHLSLRIASVMNDETLGTLKRSDKGPVAPPPVLDGNLGTVSEVVSAWPGVTATVHWDLYDRTRVDGIDFYVGELELGHLHLDRSLHLATNPSLGATLISEGLAKPFPYAKGWVCADVDRVGPDATIELFRRNYDRLAPAN